MKLPNEDEKKLFEMINNLKPYDVMKIAIDPWDAIMSVNIQNNKSEHIDFKIERKPLEAPKIDK